MSAIRVLSDKPDPARLKGAWRRSGHCTTLALAVAKLQRRERSMIAANSSKGGESRGCFVTAISMRGWGKSSQVSQTAPTLLLPGLNVISSGEIMRGNRL